MTMPALLPTTLPHLNRLILSDDERELFTAFVELMELINAPAYANCEVCREVVEKTAGPKLRAAITCFAMVHGFHGIHSLAEKLRKFEEAQ
jgi:predicted metal-dependent hydrolase